MWTKLILVCVVPVIFARFIPKRLYGQLSSDIGSQEQDYSDYNDYRYGIRQQGIQFRDYDFTDRHHNNNDLDSYEVFQTDSRRRYVHDSFNIFHQNGRLRQKYYNSEPMDKEFRNSEHNMGRNGIGSDWRVKDLNIAANSGWSNPETEIEVAFETRMSIDGSKCSGDTVKVQGNCTTED